MTYVNGINFSTELEAKVGTAKEKMKGAKSMEIILDSLGDATEDLGISKKEIELAKAQLISFAGEKIAELDTKDQKGRGAKP